MRLITKGVYTDTLHQFCGIMNYPVIFIHFGDSDYLFYTLKCAKVSNADSRIILLGDNSNDYSAIGMEHFYFSDYNYSEEIKLFEKVYKFIVGNDHGKEYWTKFGFKKWVYIFNYIREHSIDRFWTFDSDNLIPNIYKIDHQF